MAEVYSKALVVKEVVRLLRQHGFEVIVAHSAGEDAWLIHAEAPNVNRKRGDAYLARQAEARAAEVLDKDSTNG